jgi:hypothetical protein
MEVTDIVYRKDDLTTAGLGARLCRAARLESERKRKNFTDRPNFFRLC